MTPNSRIFSGLTCLALSLMTRSASAQSPRECAALSKLTLPRTTIHSAELINSGSFTPPGEKPLKGLPGFCRVSLTVEPSINVEVWMPESGWDGRFRGIGGSGYAGFIEWNALAGALKEGSAVANTDSGHMGNVSTGAFAFDAQGHVDMDRVVTFASRSLFEMTRKAKAVVAAFYGRPADHSYWSGCSTGGRQGLMQVQRTPDAYDGVIAGAPAINWERFIAAEIWPQIVMNEILGAPLSQSKWDLVNQAALEACDAGDGLKDGLVSNPAQCNYDPAALRCKERDDPAICLGDEEIEAVRKVWEGPRRADGTRIWSGIDPTVTNVVLAGERAFPIAADHARWVMDDAKFDWHSLTMADFPAFFDKSVARFNDVIGTDEADISAFRDAGGKLILWHGLADQFIFPAGTIDYYQRVVANTGTLAQTQEFARLFLAPGTQHCGGGPGPNAFGSRESRLPVTVAVKMDADHDLFHALVRWVENGVAPEKIIAAHYKDNDPAKGIERTRPLCLYPTVATYKGAGDTNDATNFECTMQR